MGEAIRRTPGAQRPAPYLDTGEQSRNRGLEHRAERARTPNRRAVRAKTRTRVAEVLRGWRQEQQPNPWTPEAVARRNQAAAVLAGGLWLLGDDLRAQTVTECGTVRALWEPVTRSWAEGEGGCLVAQAAECGHRLCAHCAPRASRRNRRRIVARLAVLAGIQGEAERRTLAVAAQRRLDAADASAAFFEDHLGALPAGDPMLEPRAPSHAATVYELHGALVTAEATPVPVDHVSRELCLVEPSRVARQTIIARFAWSFRVAREHPAEVDRRRRLAQRYTHTAYPRHAAHAIARALADLARAIAREDAAAALADAEHPRRWRAMRAACDAADAHAESALAEPLGPPHLVGHDATRATARLRAIETGSPHAARAERALDAAIGQGYARRNAAHEVRALRAAARSAQSARRLWLLRDKDRATAQRLAARAQLWRDTDARFITLTTLDQAGETARAGINRTAAALAQLTRSGRWRSHVAGAIVRLEVERSTPQTRRGGAHDQLGKAAALAAAGLIDEAERERKNAAQRFAREKARKRSGVPLEWWHPHAHIAASCGWWPQVDLDALWRRSVAAADLAAHPVHGPPEQVWPIGPRARDDQESAEKATARGWRHLRSTALAALTKTTQAHADIRAPSRGTKGLSAELTKYITKPTGIGHLTEHEAADLAQGLRGRSTLRCTGALRGLTLPEEEQPKRTLEAATGDGYQAPMGYVADETSAYGRRGVFLAPSTDDADRRVGEWVSSPKAQEAVRAAKERAHDRAHQQRAPSAPTEDRCQLQP